MRRQLQVFGVIHRLGRVAWWWSAIVCVLGLLATSDAVADIEPNNSILQAESAGLASTVTGSLASGADVDFYYLTLASQSQMTVDATSSVPLGQPELCDASFEFRDHDGIEISAHQLDADAPYHLSYTTPLGTNRFYFYVWSMAPSCGIVEYSITLSPPGALVAGPPLSPQAPSSEPNESSAQAVGPLRGGLVYTGDIGTANDEDWFFFHTLPGRSIDVAATNDGLGAGCVSTYVDGDYLPYPWTNAVRHWTHTFTAPETVFVQVKCNTGQPGGRYGLEITPADAVTAFSPRAQRCAAARKAYRTWNKRIRKTKKQLRKAHGKARRSLRHKLKSQRGMAKRAHARIRANC